MKGINSRDFAKKFPSYVTIGICLLASIILPFGIIKNITVFIGIILALLISIAVFQVCDQNKKLEKIEENIENNEPCITYMTDNYKITKYETAEKGYAYLAKRLAKVEKKVDHVSMSFFNAERQISSFQKYKEVKNRIIRSNEITYRYVINVDKDDSKTKKDINDLINTYFKKDSLLSIAYFELTPENKEKGFPYPSFIIFDDLKEVFFYFPGKVNCHEVTYSTDYQMIVEMFADYFERLLTCLPEKALTSQNYKNSNLYKTWLTQ